MPPFEPAADTEVIFIGAPVVQTERSITTYAMRSFVPGKLAPSVPDPSARILGPLRSSSDSEAHDANAPTTNESKTRALSFCCNRSTLQQ